MSGRQGALLPTPIASLAPMAVYAIGVPGGGVGAGVPPPPASSLLLHATADELPASGRSASSTRTRLADPAASTHARA